MLGSEPGWEDEWRACSMYRSRTARGTLRARASSTPGLSRHRCLLWPWAGAGGRGAGDRGRLCPAALGERVRLEAGGGSNCARHCAGVGEEETEQSRGRGERQSAWSGPGWASLRKRRWLLCRSGGRCGCCWGDHGEACPNRPGRRQWWPGRRRGQRR